MVKYSNKLLKRLGDCDCKLFMFEFNLNKDEEFERRTTNKNRNRKFLPRLRALIQVYRFYNESNVCRKIEKDFKIKETQCGKKCKLRKDG